MPDILEPVIPPQTQPTMPLPEETVMVDEVTDVENPPESMQFIDRLNAYLSMTNIAEDIEETVLASIASKVTRDYNTDKESRSAWEELNKEALSLAGQLCDEKKDPNTGEPMANVKYPTLSTAAIQFSARAYGTLVKGRDIVKAKVVGLRSKKEQQSGEAPETPEQQYQTLLVKEQEAIIADKQKRADRLSQFMSYQVLEEIDDWEDSLDQLLVTLPVVGCCFKKTYWDRTGNKVLSPLVMPEDLVVNINVKKIESAQRVTHVIELFKNDMVERVRQGIFLDVEFGEPEGSDDGSEVGEDAPHVFLEQHTWWDLDEDGYKEPYVITVHQTTEKVVRIVPRYDADGIVSNENGEIIRIEPVNYFTRFMFMPAFDGNFYGMGFGSLLAPLNATINTTINELLDAGRRASRQGGFVGKGTNIGAQGEIYIRAGEWKSIPMTGPDLQKSLVPLPVAQPSSVLFSLLNLMMEAAKDLSVSDILAGEQRGANESPTTVLALIEQAMKVFTAIYKRTYRSLKSEFKKIRRLDRLYLQESHYQEVLDDMDATMADFYEKDMDVMPVADESELTNVQRLMKAEALLEMSGRGLNEDEINRRYLEALELTDIEKLIPKTKDTPPDPEIEFKRMELELKKQRVDSDIALNDVKIREIESKMITDAHMEKLDGLSRIVQMQTDAIAKLTDRITGA